MTDPAPPAATMVELAQEGSCVASSRNLSSALHLLTITPFYPRIGNETSGCFIAEPVAELSRAGLQLSVFAVDPIYRARPREYDGAPEASWYRYPSLPGGTGLASAGRGLYWRLHKPMAALHRRSRIDIIHAHGALPCGHAAALLSRDLNVPYVVTVHGLDAFSTAQVPGWPSEWCKRASCRVFETARHVIGVSQRVCSQVEMASRANCRTVYNGVDPDLFAPGRESSAPVILTVGNLIASKGHRLLARSLAFLKPEFPQLTWEVIGDGPELEVVRALARDLGVLGSIRFLGRRSRRFVADAYRRCTIFVLPSSSEGLGCVYLEAMACGKPAVACTGQGIEEVINNGENGWLVSPNDSKELTAGLRVLLGDAAYRAQLGKAARQTILNGFTLGHQAGRLMTLYRECMG